MESLYSKVITKAICSLLWPDDNSYKCWIERVVPSNCFIKDLSLDNILDSLRFEREDREKVRQLFENPCISEGVLQYRLDIMQDFVENQWLANNFREFIKTMVFIRKCSEKRFLNAKGVHMYTYFFEKAASYKALITGIWECLEAGKESIRSAGLKQLMSYVGGIIEDQDFKDMTDDIKNITGEYESLSGVYLEFGYYEGLKDIAINMGKTKKRAIGEEPLISQLLRHGAAFLEDCDKKNCNIYYDARFSRLEEIVFERLQMKKPAIFESLQAFYNKYSDHNFEDICDLKVEAEFYIKFSELVYRMENLGLKVCKPVIRSSQAKNTKIDGLYDLSLALQMIKDGKYELSNYIVCNDLSFDEYGEIFILTGPNKGGKTTFIRSIGIAQILFQAGCFVPALRAEMDIVDVIHTHFPEEETLGVDKGRLGEEAERISTIINNSTSNSLVLLNETFSSTRRVDGYYLGKDVLKILMKLKCRGVYVTHFGELADNVDALNEEVPDGSRLACLAAGIEDCDGSGLTGNRTFRIQRTKSVGLGYSRDIVLKHGLSSEQIEVLLKRRGYIPV